jgi:iron(III) transport system substrate-binding protein
MGILLLGITPGLEAAGAKAGDSGPLIVYTNSGSDGRGEWLMDQAKAAGFNIEVVQLGGGTLVSRLIAEKNNPVGDCVFGLSPSYYETLKKNDVIVKWEPSWVNSVDKALADPEGYYYPIFIGATFFVYNADVIPPSSAPKDLIDLATNPALKGKYTIRNLTGSTSQAFPNSILQQFLQPGGVLGVSDRGWEVVKQFIRNGHIEQEGEDFEGNLINGTYPMLQTYFARYLYLVQTYPQNNFEMQVPPVGLSYTVEQTAILKNSKNFERSRAFLNWFGGADLQSKWSAQFNTVPAHEEAFKTIAPDVQAAFNKLHPQALDWKITSEMLPAWIEKIQLEFVQ